MYPPFGKSRIRCGAGRGCKWQGLETDLKKVPRPVGPGQIGVSDNVCPACGKTGYYFIGGEVRTPAFERITDPAEIEAAFAADFEAEGAPHV